MARSVFWASGTGCLGRGGAFSVGMFKQRLRTGQGFCQRVGLNDLPSPSEPSVLSPGLQLCGGEPEPFLGCFLLSQKDQRQGHQHRPPYRPEGAEMFPIFSERTDSPAGHCSFFVPFSHPPTQIYMTGLQLPRSSAVFPALPRIELRPFPLPSLSLTDWIAWP